MNDGDTINVGPHAHEMRATLDARLGSSASLKLSARAMPAGLVSIGLLASAILLSVAVVVRAARIRR